MSALVFNGHSQQTPAAAVAVKKEPGLKLTLTAGGKSDTRAERLAALFVPKGQAVSPFLPVGAFTAKYEGEIISPLRGEYTLTAEVQGAVKVSVGGKLLLEGAGDVTQQVVSKAVQLNKGGNALLIEFSADGSHDAVLRLKWASSEFPEEPVPPASLQRTPDGDLEKGALLREGRLLFAQLRCGTCHEGMALLPPRGQGMPELAQDAPMFAEYGAKFNEAWLAQWISDPHATRPGSLMPRVFADAKPGAVDQRAADLAAFLVTQGQRDDTAPAAENAPLGGVLFASLGCIACHTTPTASGKDEHGRIPLSHVKAKWQPAALRKFLQNPQDGYAWRRMPHFRLNEEESTRIAAFLLAGEQPAAIAGPKGDVARGGQLLATANCISCHAGAPAMTAPKLDVVLKNHAGGCLSADAAGRKNAPDFVLQPRQRTALAAFLDAGLDSLKQDVPAEFAERQFVNLRCAACHSRDGKMSTWASVEGEMAELQAAAPAEPHEEGTPVVGAVVPPLSWVGEKLHTGWMEKFLAGQIASKPRPWMAARMPGFPTQSATLALGLSHAHGFSAEPEKEAAPDKELATTGETLISENGGFNCIQCHGVGERAATAVFEAPGPNLALAHERIRRGYYDRWLLHPMRVDPDTKMPRFSDDEGRTPLTDHLEGDARKQFGAIWEYLRTIAK